MSQPRISISTPQTANRDLKFINAFLQNSFETTIQPRSTAQLANIIKNRLAKTSKSKDQKNVCRQWLASKGVSIQPLLSLVTNQRKKEKDQFERQQPKQDTSKIENSQLQLLRQQQALGKVLSKFEQNLKNCHASHRHYKKRRIQNLLHTFNILERNQNRPVPIGKGIVARNPEKRKNYINLIHNLMDKERQGDHQINWIQTFCDAANHKIWKVLFAQLKHVNFSESPHIFTKQLLLNSLQIVQSQFNELLPLNNDGLNQYLQKQYLSRLQSEQYVIDPQHGSLWGKVFLLYRAGRISQALKLLEKCQQSALVHSISASEENIRLGTPQKYFVQNDQEQRDVFRDQLLYALGGERKYSSDVLSDPLSLDCVWILLRNTGIFYDTDYDQFKQIRTKMIQFYRDNDLQAQSLYFRLYLLDYDSVVQLAQNQVLDKDDFMHLLIVLSRYPRLTNNRTLLEQRLTEQAISYATELIHENNPNYIYYLMQIPWDKFIDEASTVIVSGQLYDQADWPLFKQYQKQEYFQTFLKITTEKYVENTGNYMVGARTIRKFTGAVNISLDLLSQMLIKHITQEKIFDGEQVTDALNKFQKWSDETTTADRSYCKLLELFGSERKLAKMLVNRNYEELERFVVQAPIVMANLDFQQVKMFEKLREIKGLAVYFIFVRSLLRAAEIVLSSNGKLEELRGYRYEVLKHIRALLEHERMEEVGRQPSAIQLVDDLNASLDDTQQPFHCF